jgi:hypothetical protein
VAGWTCLETAIECHFLGAMKTAGQESDGRAIPASISSPRRPKQRSLLRESDSLLEMEKQSKGG